MGSATPAIDLPFDASAMLAGLHRWVECESPTWDAAAVNRMMRLAAYELAALGASVETIPGRMGFGDCLRARFPHPQTDAAGILILGHMDTVHPLGTLARLPFREEGGRCCGPGILDMKGGNYLAIEAMRQLLAPKPPTRGRLCEDALELMGTIMPFARNTEIYGENEPADYLYKVISGTVRVYKILVDGRRQIGAFHLAGDVFGLETGDEHSFSAEAITDCKIALVKRSALTALAARDNEVARQMWSITGRELHRAQAHLVLLVRSAQERVAAFLLDMAERATGGDAVELAMSRQDIADYLGLTIETVSRTLTHLEKTLAIELPTSRRIVLRNHSALSRLNS